MFGGAQPAGFNPAPPGGSVGTQATPSSSGAAGFQPMSVAPAGPPPKTILTLAQADLVNHAEEQRTYFIGYQLASLLAEDWIARGEAIPSRKPSVNAELSKTDSGYRAVSPLAPLRSRSQQAWVVDTHTGDVRLHLMLEALQIPHRDISVDLLPMARLSRRQTVFLTAWDDKLFDLWCDAEPQTLEKLRAFVENGGQLVLVSSAVRICSRLWPARVAVGDPAVSSLTYSPVHVVARDDASTHGYLTVKWDVAVEAGVRLLQTPTRDDVQVALNVSSRLVPNARAAAARFPAGAGTVWVWSCPLLEREQESSDGKWKSAKRYLKRVGASRCTIRAWRCAINSGYGNAIAGAQSAFPFILYLARTLLQQHMSHRNTVVPPEEEDYEPAPQISAPPVLPLSVAPAVPPAVAPSSPPPPSAASVQGTSGPGGGGLLPTPSAAAGAPPSYNYPPPPASWQPGQSAPPPWPPQPGPAWGTPAAAPPLSAPPPAPGSKRPTEEDGGDAKRARNPDYIPL